MIRFTIAALLLAPTLAWAARYDSDADRAALRQAATVCHATIVDTTGLPLEPEKVPAIKAGLDEGLRLARLAAAAAGSLDAAAKARSKNMATGADALDQRIKELAEPVVAARLRADGFSSELVHFRKKIEKLPEEDQKKFKPRVAKASGELASAADALRLAEGAVKIMEQRALEMRAAHKQGLKSLEEVSSDSTATIDLAGKLPAPVAEVKERLAALGQVPREIARARALEKIEQTRGTSLLLFQAADRACNRADDFRRASSAYNDASDAFEAATPQATASEAKRFLDEAEKTLALIRELLKKPS